MASIRARKGKRGTTYRAEISLSGHPRLSETFDRKSDALRWAEEVEYALKNNLPLPGEELPQDDKFIGKAIDDYLQITERDNTRSRHTILTDRGTAKRLQAQFGKMSMRALMREDIEAYKAARLRIVGPATVRHDMSMLSRLYEVARVEWRMKDLPYPGQDVPLPPQPRERRAIVPEMRFDRLLEECKSSKNAMLYPLVYLLLNTGMRPEEAVLMRWWQLLPDGVIDLTKTKTDPRRVPVSADCIVLFEQIPKQENTDLVFVTEEIAKKDKPVRFFRRAFEQACIRAGINTPTKRDLSPRQQEGHEDSAGSARVTLYSLRHSAASYLIMAGENLETVRDLLGHKDISQTSRYTHISDEHKKKAVENPKLPWKK